jgi:hypothetical protein
MGIDSSLIEYQERVVAFIDILGFKDIIRKSEKDIEKLVTINRVLSYLKNHENKKLWGIQLMEIEEDAQKKGLQNFDISEDIACTCFSDSIVVSVKVKDGLINNTVSTLIAQLSSIGKILMLDGVLFRGGITVGNLIHENGVVMGQALIDAYELESNVAKYPRIVLSDKLLERLNYPLLSKRDRHPFHQYIARFEDGCVGFHQMIIYQVVQNSTVISQKELKSELLKIKQIIVNGLDMSFQSPDVFHKYVWLRGQYNGLIIHDKDIKEELYSLNKDIPGNNIHYSYTDDFRYNREN